MKRHLIVAIALVFAGCGDEEGAGPGAGGGVVDDGAGEPGADDGTPGEDDRPGEPIPEGVGGGAEPDGGDVQGEPEDGEDDPDAGDEPAVQPGADEDEFDHEGAGGGDGQPGDGADGGGADGGDDPVEGGDDPGPDGPPLTVEQCFEEIGGDLGPDYNQFEPIVGSHCHGTNH